MTILHIHCKAVSALLNLRNLPRYLQPCNDFLIIAAHLLYLCDMMNHNLVIVAIDSIEYILHNDDNNN